MEVTWSQHSTQAGPPSVTCEATSRQLLGISKHRDSAASVPNTGARLVLAPAVVEKQRPVEFGNLPVATLMENVFLALIYHLTSARQIVQR